MAKTPEQLLIDIEHHQQLADYHNGEMRRALKEYQLLQGAAMILPHSQQAVSARGKIKAVVYWTDWLAKNKPAFRADIEEATGIRLTDRATPHVLVWSHKLVGHGDASYAPDKLCSIQEPAGRKGRPRLIYFRWDQRFDVRPLFGVGPERPVPDADDALLGVIQPEPEYQTGGIVSVANAPVLSEGDCSIVQTWDGAELVLGPWIDEITVEDPPIQTVPWEEQHAVVLSLAAQGVKPTQEQFALLRSTHPDGPNGANLAVALAGKGTHPELD